LIGAIFSVEAAVDEGDKTAGFIRVMAKPAARGRLRRTPCARISAKSKSKAQAVQTVVYGLRFAVSYWRSSFTR
jgi:hypothetical protein